MKELPKVSVGTLGFVTVSESNKILSIPYGLWPCRDRQRLPAQAARMIIAFLGRKIQLFTPSPQTCPASIFSTWKLMSLGLHHPLELKGVETVNTELEVGWGCACGEQGDP